jgi:hypothetical protein
LRILKTSGRRRFFDKLTSESTLSYKQTRKYVRGRLAAEFSYAGISSGRTGGRTGGRDRGRSFDDDAG